VPTPFEQAREESNLQPRGYEPLALTQRSEAAGRAASSSVVGHVAEAENGRGDRATAGRSCGASSMHQFPRYSAAKIAAALISGNGASKLRRL
jgi:hypothetical protein